jgi:hypothetical protein
MFPPLHLTIIDEPAMVSVVPVKRSNGDNDDIGDGRLLLHTFGDSPLTKFMHSLIMETNNDSLRLVVDNANTHGSPPTFPKMLGRSHSYTPSHTRKKRRVQRSKSYPHESRWKSEPVLLSAAEHILRCKTLKHDSPPVLKGRGDDARLVLPPSSLIPNVMLPQRRGTIEDHCCKKLLVMPVRRGSWEEGNKSPMKTSSLPSLSLSPNNNIDHNGNARSTAELIAMALDELILDDDFDFSDNDDVDDDPPMPMLTRQTTI